MKALRTKRLYAEISKTQKLEDGTLKVSGYASSGAVDSDGEIITPAAMKAALPDYMKFGAVREMHQAMAAGTALEATVEEDTGKTWFCAHVVDPTAILKVETGVYKGFSIGAKVTGRDKADKTIITSINLVEVSLVDRPANPEALITCFKVDGDDLGALTQEQQVDRIATMLNKGDITPLKVLELIRDAEEPDTSGTPTTKADTAPAETTPSATPAPDAQPAKTDPQPEPVVAVKADIVQKGLYGVSCLADLLISVGYLAQDAAWEASYEGDSSPLPKALRDWFAQGATILQAMAKEEADEMMASINALVVDLDAVALAAKAEKVLGKVFIAKAGAKFSKETKAALADVHKMLTDGCAKMEGLGYKKDDDTEEDAASVKNAAATDSSVAKPAELSDTIGIADKLAAAVAVQVAPLQEAITKASKENEELKQQLEAVKKMAAPGKALLKAVTIDKASESSTLGTGTAPAPEQVAPEGTPERAQQEMRKALSSGGVPLQSFKRG